MKTKLSPYRRRRGQRGQSTSVTVFALAILVLLPLGFLCFEIGRANLAREQLHTCCNAAAMAGAATIAVSDTPDTLQTHMNARTAAVNLFRRNYVLGGLQSTSRRVDSTSQYDAADGQSDLFIEFLDPNNSNAVVPMGDARGKTMRVNAQYGLVPAFGKFVGITKQKLLASGAAGVPQLDVVLCFDVSGSIDDQTPVTFVKRLWNGTSGKIDYTITNARTGSAAGANAQGTIYNILGPPATGSSVNALAPQQLGSTNTSSHSYPLYFSEETGNGANSARGLRGTTNNSPPGNHPGQGNGASTGSQYTFTDLVVNIDGRTQFGGITDGGYAFPDLATVVEAARGNLESTTTLNNSLANTSITVTPTPGYRAKYLELAARQVQPIHEAQSAGQLFFNILNQDADTHFGLVAFTDFGGTSPTTTLSNSNVDSTYSAAGNGSFPVPGIVLNPAVNQTNYTTAGAAVSNTYATGGTNIGDAITCALDQLQRHSRPGSKKAIVVFTDGQPTVGNPLSSDPWTNARKAAQNAKTAGIPIYTIGLAQTPAIISGEKAILNDWDNNTSSGGIAAIAGGGGRFFLVTNQQNLRYTFESLARQLVQLVRDF